MVLSSVLDCKSSTPICKETVDLYSDTGANYVTGPILDTFTIGCGVCTQTKNGRYRADNCNEYGWECKTTTAKIVPCDHFSQYDVVHHDFTAYADGAVSSACCNVNTGGCDYSCKGRVAQSRSSVVQPTPAPSPNSSKKPPACKATVDIYS